MLVNWDERWVELSKNGTTVRLKAQEEIINVHMCKAILWDKEIKNGSELMVARIHLCGVTYQPMDLSNIPTELQPLLLQYAALFQAGTALPPTRERP
jgi:hypothetical protein